jgi:hypothetical protein
MRALASTLVEDVWKQNFAALFRFATVDPV